MKVRTGFVSNSSSSSFIVRKSALSTEEMNKVREFFQQRDGWFNTEIMGEDETYLWGDLEAHNTANTFDFEDEPEEGEPNDKETANNLFTEMMYSFSIGNKDYCNRYEEYVTPENLGDSNEGWTGETCED